MFSTQLKGCPNQSARITREARKLVMVRWIALLLASWLNAQVAPPLKYKVVKAGKPEQTVIALNELADQGYRLIVPGKMLILRLEATPPDIYRYMSMDLKGGPAQFLNWLNDQGAHGYRPVWGTGVMEKEPHPKNYEYESVTAGYAAWGRTRSLTASDLVGQGYHAVGLGRFFLYIGAPQNEMFFERELGLKPRPVRTSGGREIEIADAMRAGNVMKHVDALAHNGYRYLCPYASQKGGGLAVMMQKCDQDCGGTFEYRYFDVRDVGQLDKELNKQGREGFRVVPQALLMRPHVLERAVVKTEAYAYHVLKTQDANALEQVLNIPEQEEYVPIGYVWRGGVWTAEELLVLEKVTGSLAAHRAGTGAASVEVTYTR